MFRRLLLPLALTLGSLLPSLPVSARLWVNGEFTQPRYDGAYLSEIRTDRYLTPHLAFAKPLAGGPVRALFIVPKSGRQTREVVELGERLHLVFAAVTTTSPEQFQDDFPYTTAVLGESTPEKERELSRKLDASYDVMSLLDQKWDTLPPSAQFKLLRAVRAGTGLLGVFPNTRPPASVFSPLQPPVSGREILRGCAWAGLPYFKIGPHHTPDQAADETLTAAHFGAGRIAWLNYGGVPNQAYWYGGDCLGLPAPPSADAWDVALATAARALLWAAHREPRLQVQSDLPDGAQLSLTAWPAHLTGRLLLTGPAPGPVKIEVRLRRLGDDGPGLTASAPVTPTAPSTPFSVALAPGLRGTHFLWLIARDAAGAVLDWSVTTVQITGGPRLASLTVERDTVAPGETCPVRVTVEGDLPPAATVTLSARDGYDRLFWAQAQPAAAQLRFEVPTAAACGRWVRLQARLAPGPTPCDQADAEFFLPRQVGPEFINLIWGHPGLGPSPDKLRGYLADLQGRTLMQAGFNTGMIFHHTTTTVSSCKELARANAAWMFYITYINDGVLRRCFDPAQRAAEEQRLEQEAAAARPFGTFVYSLGDENSYTVHEELQPAELAAYQVYLAQAYAGDLAALNREWGSAYPSFSAVTAAPPPGQPWSVPRHYDLTAFWEQVYADTHHWMAAAVRRGDPDARVGAEGSSSGNLAQVISGLDWWAPYEDRYTNALLRFWLPGDSLRGNWWGGYTVNSGARGGPEILWHQLATGSVNASLFFIAAIASEGCLASDLSVADYMDPWLPQMQDICATAGPLLRTATPVDDGVAIYWSHLSDLASTFDNRFGNNQTAQSALLSLCDGLGINARFLTDQQIAAGRLDPRQTRLLLMLVPQAIPDGLAGALQAYVQAGGVVICDVAPDLRDAHGAEVPPGRLLSLFGAKSTGPPQPRQASVKLDHLPLRGATLTLDAGPCLTDAAVAAGPGTALATAAGGIPLLMSRQWGAGLALLLNFDLYHALLGARAREAQSPQAATTPAGDFLLSLLQIAGLRPAFSPQPGLPWQTVRRLRLADATVVGLDHWQGPAAAREFVAGGNAVLHPLRAGLGADAQGTLAFPAGAPDTALVAVLPPGPRELRLSGPDGLLKPALPPPGAVSWTQTAPALPYTVSLLVSGRPLAGSLLRFDVLDPQGRPLEAYRQFVLTAAQPLTVTWRPALNEWGQYRVRVTELLSGKIAEQTVRITRH